MKKKIHAISNHKASDDNISAHMFVCDGSRYLISTGLESVVCQPTVIRPPAAPVSIYTDVCLIFITAQRVASTYFYCTV